MAQQQTYHIEIDEGTDYSQVFTMTDNTTGLAQNLTGYSARMDVRGIGYNSQFSVNIPIAYDSATSVSTRGISLGGAAGTVTVTIPYSDTLAGGWNGGTTGTYDIFLTDTLGVRSKFIKGFFTIKPSTTKLV
jgi:hypothetical protein